MSKNYARSHDLWRRLEATEAPRVKSKARSLLWVAAHKPSVEVVATNFLCALQRPPFKADLIPLPKAEQRS
jgi:hypothetical protein